MRDNYEQALAELGESSDLIDVGRAQVYAMLAVADRLSAFLAKIEEIDAANA